MNRTLIVLTSLTALAASNAWAQKVEIGAVAGWTLSDGVTGDAIRAGDGNLYNGLGPKDSFSYALDLGFFVSENIEIGGLFSQQKSNLLFDGAVERDLGSWSVDNYHGYLAFNSGDHQSKARFYFLAGLGATRYGGLNFTTATGTARSIGGTSQFSTTWGTGVKIYPGKNFGLKLGMRWTPTYIKSDPTGWWCDPYWGCYVTGDSQYSNQFEFGGGITLRF